jgi:hypothetical protein
VNQLDTSEEKLFDRHARDMLFGDDDDPLNIVRATHQ